MLLTRVIKASQGVVKYGAVVSFTDGQLRAAEPGTFRPDPKGEKDFVIYPFMMIVFPKHTEDILIKNCQVFV